MRLFSYGTLMVPAVWEKVVGRPVSYADAVLNNYACHRLCDECYPGLLPKSGAQTKGRVYQGLRQQDLRRLDQYEGKQYRRLRLRVRMSGEKTVSAWCYVIRAKYLYRVSGEPWSLEEFVQKHLKWYLHRL